MKTKFPYKQKSNVLLLNNIQIGAVFVYNNVAYVRGVLTTTGKCAICFNLEANNVETIDIGVPINTTDIFPEASVNFGNNYQTIISLKEGNKNKT